MLALQKSKALGARRVLIHSDSKVVSGQVEGEFQSKNEELARYTQAVRKLQKSFLGFTVKKISRTQNKEADAIARAISQGLAMPPNVFYEVTFKPAIDEEKACKEVSAIESEDWKTPIIAFLSDNLATENSIEYNSLQTGKKLHFGARNTIQGRYC